MYVFYENVQQCFVIKVLFGFKEQKLTQPDLKRNKYCKDAAGNAVNINRQVLKCCWASGTGLALRTPVVSKA